MNPYRRASLANCEDVDRGGGGNSNALSLGIGGPRRLGALLRNGLVGRLAGFQPGAVRISVSSGRRVLATGRAQVGQDGRATARLRFTRTARRSLARRRSVTLIVKAGPMKRKVKVTRR